MVKTTADNRPKSTETGGTYNHIHDYMHTYMLSLFPTSHSQFACLCIGLCVIIIACIPNVLGVQAELAPADQQLGQLRQQVNLINM